MLKVGAAAAAVGGAIAMRKGAFGHTHVYAFKSEADSMYPGGFRPGCMPRLTKVTDYGLFRTVQLKVRSVFPDEEGESLWVPGKTYVSMRPVMLHLSYATDPPGKPACPPWVF